MANVVGVVGAGAISRFHFRAFEQIGTKVRIVADLNRAGAQGYLDMFGAEYADSYEAVVTHPEVNVVAVFTGSPTHYEICRAALERGKHVVCEKTLTLSAQESYELGKLAEEKGLLLYTSYMKRFFPAVRKAKELVPRLGHIMSVYCRTYQGNPKSSDMHTGEVKGGFAPGEDGVSPIKRRTGGGVLVCGGSHILDLLLYLIGKPPNLITSVYGRRFVRKGFDVDFMFHALMDLAGGGVVHFEGNWHPLKRIGYEARGWDEGFEISGVKGRLVLETPVWNEPEHNAASLRYYDNEAETWTEFAFDTMDPFVEAEKHFLGQIEKGEQGEMDRYVGYRTDQLIETLWRSAGEGRPLAIDWKA